MNLTSKRNLEKKLVSTYSTKSMLLNDLETRNANFKYTPRSLSQMKCLIQEQKDLGQLLVQEEDPLKLNLRMTKAKGSN